MRTKKAYLTIDDCPSIDFRSKIDYLHAQGIPAILFCQGNLLAQREEEACYAVGKGFLIANHGFEHRYFSDLTLEECKESIRRTDQFIERIYDTSGVPRPAKFFRFPYFDEGSHRSSAEYEAQSILGAVGPCEDKSRILQETLRDLGYTRPMFEGLFPSSMAWMAQGIGVRCTFDQMEYCLPENGGPGMDEEEILQRIEEDDPERGLGLNHPEFSDVMLIHDHERTTRLFFKLIDRYLQKNIQFHKAW